MMRVMLYEAAQSAPFEEMVLAQGLGDAVARRREMKKAIVAWRAG